MSSWYYPVNSNRVRLRAPTFLTAYLEDNVSIQQACLPKPPE